jgi:hypothetical protein
MPGLIAADTMFREVGKEIGEQKNDSQITGHVDGGRRP